MKKILILCALCASAFNIVTAQEITLEDIWTKGTFNAKGVAGFNSMNDGRHYSAQDKFENIIRYTFSDGNIVDTILRKADVNINGYSYSFSENEQKILLQTNFKQIYRHSFAANIYVYDVNSKTLTQPINEQVMLAEFAPDGNKLAYVKNNNLFVFDLSTNKET
ncbi:MAG: DPP IV N-terminal domain-containing protein, partial [Bacteroidia bacterium]